MQDQSFNESSQAQSDLTSLVEAVVKAVMVVNRSKDLEQALVIRDELRRLPAPLVTEVLNGVMLRLLNQDPNLCRWFVLDVFLHDADPEGKADVAERINLMLSDLQSI